jgi:nitroreductase
VAVCPYDSLEVVDGKVRICSDKSMHCGQCQAVCAFDAITVDDIVRPVPATITGNQDAETLFKIIQMRRSCRDYKDKPVSREALEDLVTYGLWAPSGTNAQKWAFTVLPNRDAVIAFAQSIANFYRKINRQAENPFLRGFTKLFKKDVLGRYYRRYYTQIRDGLKRWDEEGFDLLFHGATAAIVVSVDRRASCAHDDAIHAAQNIVLGAHAMGLGSCLIGFAIEAMKRDPSIAAMLNIPDGHAAYSVVALGHPKYKYPNPSGRLAVAPRYFTV